MAVIQKLRDKYAKLTGGIIVVALLGFILMDYGRGGSKSSTTIGKINGEKVDMTEYDALLKQTEEQMKQQNQGQTLSADQDAQLRDQVWHQIVSEHLLSAINAKLGITITDAEVNNLLTGPNPDPVVRQQFTNQKTGVFNPQEVAAQIQQIKNNPNQKVAWEGFLNDLKKRHFDQKISSLLVGSIYVPKFVMDDQIKGMTEIANAQFVKIPFSAVADKDANVTDADINKYIQEHPNRFKVPKTTRSIEYISFNVIPSSEDSAIALKGLDTLKSAFATTTDVEGFVNHNSQNAAAPQFYTEKQLKMLPNAAELMNGTVNQVIGPFYDGGSFDLAKVLDKKMLPDSVRTHHILVGIKQGTQQIRTEAAAKARIDSAIAALNAGVPFDSVAAKYSDDPNSRSEGDEGRTFVLMQKPSLESAYGKDFSDFIFAGQSGENKLLKADMENYSAYNYVQIIHQSTPVAAVKLAFVSRELSASDNTYKTIYNKASQFAAKAATDNKSFEQNAAANNLKTGNAAGIDANSYLINGLGSAVDLVKWTYDKETNIGDVSPIYTVNGNFIIAKLTGIQDKGLLKVNDQNRPMLRSLVMQDKKAQIILDKYKTTPASLALLSQKEQQPINNLDSIRFSQSFAPGLGNEPKVIGYAFNAGLKQNTVSPAIPGNEGVYFITVTSKTKVALPPQMSNEAMLQQRMANSLKQSAPQAILNSLIEKADVQDMRSNIY